MEADRTANVQRLWSAGSYERVGAMFEPVTDELVATLDLDGRRVLDAATGTGNTALAMAAAGARVDAVDITPRLLEVARKRADVAGVDIDFRLGDLVDLPSPDDAFDLVVSTSAPSPSTIHVRVPAS